MSQLKPPFELKYRAQHRPAPRLHDINRSSSSSSSWSNASSSGSSSSSASSSGRMKANRAGAPDDASKRGAQLAELLRETSRVALASGPKGFVRAMQAANAVLTVTQDFLQTGGNDPPQGELSMARVLHAQWCKRSTLVPPTLLPFYAAVLRKLFERLGATYIKLGQFIASSPSLFPDEYVLEFQKCLDRTDPVPFSKIQAVIEAELGHPWGETYASIDPVPIASASVAQVSHACKVGLGDWVLHCVGERAEGGRGDSSRPDPSRIPQ